MTNIIQEARSNAAATTVQASINEGKFFDTMKHLFASSYSVLGELMQNARRAGATRIDFTIDEETKSASVQDDGCGISDFQVLIALCDSGWDENVQITDKPFGMGLFSLFFAAETVTFRSNGRSLKVGLSDIVEKREMEIQPDPATVGKPGTRIDLGGLKESLLTKQHHFGRSGAHSGPVLTMIHEIEVRAEGFPIPVFINEKECPRPYAQQNLQGIDTPIGFVRYPGVTDDQADIQLTDHRMLYLQGLPIGHSTTDKRAIVVHLDSSQFTARMPDRSDLFDAKEQDLKIKQALREMVKLRIDQLKASMDAEEFVMKHWTNCRAHGLLHVMNDVPWIPLPEFGSINYVSKNSDEVVAPMGTCSFAVKLVHRDAIESGSIKVWRHVSRDTGDHVFSALELKVMQLLDIRTLLNDSGYSGSIDGNHWIQSITPSVLDMRFTWSVNGESGNANYWSDQGHCSIRLAESVTVEVSSNVDPAYGLTAEFTHGWVMVPEDPEDDSDDVGEYRHICYVISNEAPEYPTTALSDFLDEHDNYRDEWADNAHTEWNQAVNAMRGTPLAEMVTTVLRENLPELGTKQLDHLCLVRAVQTRCTGRDGADQLRNPSPDIIDLMGQDFWTKVGQARMPTASESLAKIHGESIREAFMAVVQPGWQQPAASSDQ